MKRIIEINNGVVYGTIKESVVKILPQLEKSFRQRKEFFEYYFDKTEIEITLEQLDALSSEFKIDIIWDTITICVH
jgi:hypothetical protein